MSTSDQELYLEMAYRQAKLLTEMYSTSFSSAIARLSPRYRKHVYAVYGMVRLGDEIVDAGFAIDEARTLASFQAEIERALAEHFSTNPIIHAFQDTVRRFDIEPALIESFFASMRADITQKTHTPESFQSYVYGSAEVVGLMCLAVFCEGDKAQYNALIAPARALGSAFQKVNFLRDVQADTLNRGRSYFPGIDLHNFSDAQKKQLEDEIQAEFDLAAAAIPNMPAGVRSGVALALAYYRQLLAEIRKTSTTTLLTKRVRVSTGKKLLVAIKTKLRNGH